jgi:hypothetical protein
VLIAFAAVVLELHNLCVRYFNRCRALGGEMSIYEAIGMAWVIFTSALASVEILYLAYVGLKTIVSKPQTRDAEVPVEVKEMFKVAR